MIIKSLPGGGEGVVAGSQSHTTKGTNKDILKGQ